MVDPWTLHSNMQNQALLRLSLSTPMSLQQIPAPMSHQRELLKSLPLLMFHKTTMLNSRLLLPNNQFQLLLKLTKLSSSIITVVSSPQLIVVPV